MFKVLITLGCIAVALILLAFAFGLQMIAVLEARAMSKTPALYVVPTELPDQSVYKGKVVAVEHGPLQWESPWPGMNFETEVGSNTFSFRAENGVSVSFLIRTGDPAVEPFFQRNDPNQATARRLYGVAGKSQYDFKRAVLETSPSDMSLWMGRGNAFRKMVFMGIKQGSMAPLGAHGIYRIETSAWKGFQFGRTSGGNSSVQVDLYGGGFYIVLMIVQSDSRSHQITQAEINRVIESFRMRVDPEEDDDDDDQKQAPPPPPAPKKRATPNSPARSEELEMIPARWS